MPASCVADSRKLLWLYDLCDASLKGVVFDDTKIIECCDDKHSISKLANQRRTLITTLLKANVVANTKAITEQGDGMHAS